MEAVGELSSATGLCASFGLEHFGGCQFGDKRLTKRAVLTADALVRHPGGTLPAKLPRNPLLGFYDLANNSKVNHDNMLEGHRQRTLAAAAAAAHVVLFIHDTTEADYSGLSIDDLGPIGNGGRHGLLLHNVLAVDYGGEGGEGGGREVEALGLAGQFIHRRRTVPRRESRGAKRIHPGRESRLWIKGVEAVGPPPAGATWVNLMDRGGDTFESLSRQAALGQRFVVRSCSNRVVRVADALGRWRRALLHDWARKLPTLGQRTVDVAGVAGADGQPPRRAKVRVAAGAMRVPAPRHQRGEHSDQPLHLGVVHVREIDPPPGVEPLEWFLLTDAPATDKGQAQQCVDWYECRPIVEEFHKSQKTGCGMETAQFTTRKALEVHIAMLSVVAVQLLRLRDLSRRADAATCRATEVIDRRYVRVLALWRFKQPRTDLSVKEFFAALARLGGHLGRTGDRSPGWLVLWRGWMDLQRLVEGAMLMRLSGSG